MYEKFIGVEVVDNVESYKMFSYSKCFAEEKVMKVITGGVKGFYLLLFLS